MMDDRQWFDVSLSYGLFLAYGGQAPGLQHKRWFFELPAQAAADDGYWRELLHRLFYDANVGMRQREPTDLNWLGLVSYEAKPFDPAHMLGWDGVVNADAMSEYFPWILADGKVVWEFGANYYIDEQGRYDAMPGHDFTELLLNRLLRAGQVDEEGFMGFVRRYYPNAAPDRQRIIWDERELRFSNLAVIRDLPGFYRKPPGQAPHSSNPLAR